MGPPLAEFVIDEKVIATYITDPSAVPEVDFILNEIFGDNEYFKHGIIVRPGDVVIDIGANIGLFGAKALSLVPGGDATYIGIEPCPETFEALQLNLCGIGGKGLEASFFHLNPDYSGPVGAAAAEGRISSPYPGNVQLMCKAVSSAPGSRAITFYPAMPGNSTLREAEKQALQGALMAPAFFKGAQHMQVTVITLDQLLEDVGLVGKPVGLLKVDVEGEELEVLRGLSAENWQQVQQVVMEVHDCMEGETGAANIEATAAAASLPDLSGPRGSGIDGDCIQYVDAPDAGHTAAAAAAAAAAMAAADGDNGTAATSSEVNVTTGAEGVNIPPPRDRGRVMAVAQMLKGLGFMVVIEPVCILVDGKAINYNVYARRGRPEG